MQDHKHFASSAIDEKLRDLHDLSEETKILRAERAMRLEESLRSQKYYAEASEAEHWIRERMPLVANQDTGANQTAAEAHLRRLTTLEQEIAKFSDEVQRLREMCDEASNHFDSAQVMKLQT